jgi:pimeloyl-ACP methyl ester carboxylesterase
MRWALFGGAAVALVTLALGWPWVAAQARGVVVISSVMDAPVVTPVVEGLSGEPAFAEETVAGNVALVARPAGEGPWPAFFFVNGTVRQGRELPEVRELAGGFARAGYLVVVPDLPGLREEEPSPETVAETVEVARAVAAMPDTEGGAVALVGVSTGGALALTAARDDGLDGRVSVVAAVAPYSDIRTVLQIATTGHYEVDGKFEPYRSKPFLSYVAARSLVGALPEGRDREVLMEEVRRVEREDPDPLANWRGRETGDLGPEARAVVEVLANTDPRRFDELYAALPEEVRAEMEALSAVHAEGDLEARVEIATGPRDRYFPASESYRVRGFAPGAYVTVTPALDHAEVGFSPRDVPSFVRFDAFVVRSLREASAG